MADRWEWTQKLGEAFKAQQSDVMASVQRLRSKAYAAGNLKTTSEQKVVVKGDVYEIEPANPRSRLCAPLRPGGGIRDLVVAGVSAIRILSGLAGSGFGSWGVWVLGACSRGTGLGLGLGSMALARRIHECECQSEY